MVPGDIELVNPVGLDELVSETVPVNPPKGVIEMMEVFEEPPAWTVRECGLAERVNPAPVTVTCMSRLW